MKHPHVRRLCGFVLTLAVVATVAAQIAVAPVAPGTRTTTNKAELDLPRLKSKGKAGEPAPLAKSKITVDELRPHETGGGRFATRQNLVYLTLDAGKEWTRPLKSARRVRF